MALLCLCFIGCAPISPWHISNEQALGLYAANSKPTLVVDIDNTIVNGETLNSLRLMFPSISAYEEVPPFAKAPEALRTLQQDYNVVLLTARTDWFEETTLKWLKTHHFPDMPVIFSYYALTRPEERSKYKQQVISALKGRGLNPTHGIGDKPSDIHAYHAQKLQPILLVDGLQDRDLKAAMRAIGIHKLPDKRLLVLFSQDDSWRQIVRHLSSRELLVPPPPPPASKEKPRLPESE